MGGAGWGAPVTAAAIINAANIAPLKIAGSGQINRQ
jgi:hypothetical protein